MNKILGPNYEGDHVKYLGKLYFKILLNISYFRFKEELIFNNTPSHINVSTYFFFSDSK